MLKFIKNLSKKRRINEWVYRHTQIIEKPFFKKKEHKNNNGSDALTKPVI